MIFACLLTVFGGEAAAGAADGLRLFADSMLPCLFPFMVCGYYLAGEKQTLRGGKPGAVWLAMTCAVCGTPSAALACGRLTGLSRRRASMLCAALNQTGPLFLTGVLCADLLGAPRLWPMFAAAHYLPAALAAVVIMPSCGGKAPADSKPIERKEPLLRFAGALSDAVSAILRVGGTVVFFRVLHTVVSAAGVFSPLPSWAAASASGLLEMTNGLALAAAEGMALRAKCALCGFLLSFGGVCVFMQSKLFMRELSPLPYFAVKLGLGMASGLICWLLFPYVGGASSAVAGLDETLALTRAGTLASGGLCMLLSVCASALFARIAVRRRPPV